MLARKLYENRQEEIEEIEEEKRNRSTRLRHDYCIDSFENDSSGIEEPYRPNWKPISLNSSYWTPKDYAHGTYR